MIKPINPHAAFAADVQGLAGLKRAAKDAQPTPETIKQVASQFEALFMHMMLKSMREASFGDDLFGSEQSNFYRDLYDQQLSVTLARKHGLGLADVLVRQLGGDQLMAAVPGASTTDRAGLMLDRSFPTRSTSSVPGLVDRLRASLPADAQKPRVAADPTAFVHTIWSHAERAAKSLNVAPEAIVAVAALETGWGRAVMQYPDGRSANNLFGIKAGAGWQGARVSADTTEYVNGTAVSRREQFRAYDSISDSVDDFARFLRDNPRYRDVMSAGSDARDFVESLARGGYATDPVYARKLQSILGSDTLRTALNELKMTSGRPITA